MQRMVEGELEASPFSNPVDRKTGRTFHWTEPTHVVEVAFNNWAEDGHLRHPVYLGHRTDKDPRAVVREIAE